MDLVEIRKKAKGKKKKPADQKTPVADMAVEQQETGAQEPVSVEEPPLEDSVAESPAASPMPSASDSVGEVTADRERPVAAEALSDDSTEPDPLDALFAFSVEGGLATDESYLQALVDEDEAVDLDVQQWLTFSLTNEEYALTIDSVSEIIKPREVTDIPRVPDFIRGIISLRGIIVPVFDLNRRLNLGSSELSSASRIIVCQDDERLAGFLVDSINQVVNVPLASIEPPPTVLSGLDRDFVEGVGRVEDKMLILLHLSNVINAELV